MIVVKLWVYHRKRRDVWISRPGGDRAKRPRGPILAVNQNLELAEKPMGRNGNLWRFRVLEPPPVRRTLINHWS